MRDAHIFLAIIVLIAFSECLGQGCLKKYSLNNNTVLYWVGVAFYALVCLLLVLSYKYKSMGLINILWSGLSVLLILSVGFLFFNETISQMDWIGVGLILAGMTCIVWEDEQI
jgi:multidrug transporter EmrE-like cation transporter